MTFAIITAKLLPVVTHVFAAMVGAAFGVFVMCLVAINRHQRPSAGGSPQAPGKQQEQQPRHQRGVHGYRGVQRHVSHSSEPRIRVVLNDRPSDSFGDQK